MSPIETKLERLRSSLVGMREVLVAFSGGADSSFLVRVAHDTLGRGARALTTVSPTNPDEDTDQALALARELGAEHIVLYTNELEIPSYKENPVNRCYLCKSNLYEIARAEASRRSIPWIVDGVNFDDLGDYRPGLEAAAESAIRHPLADAELTKSEIRALSKELGLRTWDRPASPCLSSRFPYGTPISPAGLEKVARGEKWLKSRGLCECRVRYYDDLARIEVPVADHPRLMESPLREEIALHFREVGFRLVEIDPRGFRSGSLNEALSK